MKKYILLLLIFSCVQKHVKTEEEAKQEALEQVKKIAAPHIIEDTMMFNLCLKQVKDTTLSYGQRIASLRKLHTFGFEYTAGFGLNTINNPETDSRANMQKELIIAQWMEKASREVYKQSLIDLENSKK